MVESEQNRANVPAAKGPPWRATLADWLLDRVNGTPAQSEFRYVTATGVLEQRSHPRQS